MISSSPPRLKCRSIGSRDLTGATVEWTLRSDSGQTIGEGRWDDVDLPRGGLRQVGTLDVLACGSAPCQPPDADRVVRGTPFVNDWQIWVYPPISDTAPARRRARDSCAGRTRRDATEGRAAKCCCCLRRSAIAGDTSGSFEPVFWNRLWFPTQEVHTLGVLCDPQHPALAAFPTDCAQQLAVVGSVQAIQAHDPRWSAGRDRRRSSSPSTTGTRVEDWDWCSRPSGAGEADGLGY